VPVPRRFDRRPPERDSTRINERIRVPEVRVIGEDGTQIGVMRTDEALRYAQERDLDLVEVAPEARPPVCRVLDYSKYKYEQSQKQKAARKHQQQRRGNPTSFHDVPSLRRTASMSIDRRSLVVCWLVTSVSQRSKTYVGSNGESTTADWVVSVVS